MGDEAVQATNEDATSCKLSAVQLGYWRDPYVQLMYRKSVRRAPEIHLGYYARVQGFRLTDENKPIQNFVEVDFSGVTSKKCFIIKRNKELLTKVADAESEVKFSRTDLHGNRYHLVAADFSNSQNLQDKFAESEVDYQCPTVILAECALVYADSTKVDTVLSWLGKQFTSMVFINYEQINMEDKFGKVMVDNLWSRGCMLSGVAACKDKQSQISRFTNNGWESATCWTMNEVYSLLPQEDVFRVEKIEMLDEKELLRQLFEHYCITVARKNSPNFNFDSVNFD